MQKCYRVKVYYDRWRTRQGGDGVASSEYCGCVVAENRQLAITSIRAEEMAEKHNRKIAKIVAVRRPLDHICTVY